MGSWVKAIFLLISRGTGIKGAKGSLILLNFFGYGYWMAKVFGAQEESPRSFFTVQFQDSKFYDLEQRAFWGAFTTSFVFLEEGRL